MRQILLQIYQCAEENFSPEEVEEAINIAEQAIESVIATKIEKAILTEEEIYEAVHGKKPHPLRTADLRLLIPKISPTVAKAQLNKILALFREDTLC